MLRTIKTDLPFRGLHATPFDRNGSRCVLGRQTVIYGRNGSGKTTLSEILRLGTRSGAVEGVTVTASIRRDGATSTVGFAGLGMTVKAYNRYWLEESLRLFLEGEGHSDPILKLGVSNVKAAARLEQVRALITRLERRSRYVEDEGKALVADIKDIEQRVKQSTIAALSPSAPAKYNKSSYTIANSKRLLRDVNGVALSDEALAGEISNASAPPVEGVPLIAAPMTAPNLRSTVNEILRSEVDSDRIPRLVDDSQLSEWVERGLNHNAVGQPCAFCLQGVLTADLFDRYRQHFSEALTNLRLRIKGGLEYLTAQRLDWENWLSRLPVFETLLVDYRGSITEEAREVSAGVARLLAQLKQAHDLLEARLADTLVAMTDEQLLPEEIEVPDVRRLLDLIDRNNAECANQEHRKQAAQNAVERHFAAADRENYERTIALSEANHRYRETVAGRLRWLAARAHDLEQSQQETGAMARLIDDDLRQHFGHSHLNISVSTGSKGYVVRRGTEIASYLSEGERNAIAFCYFLRSLEEEGVDSARTIVVIDDPVTSLDKEALFAAFALVDQRTEKFAQTIVLTHDYEFFRLLVSNLSSRRAKSVRKIDEGNVDERAFPRVSFLEIFAVIDVSSGERSSSLRTLPNGLLRHPSEYHYLFFKVANAVQSEATEELPLLGNAARRLLEGFISFRAPHGISFQKKIDDIQFDGHNEPLRSRVVKFLHGHSHREEPSPIAALDFPSIEVELRSVLDFIRLADGPHFSGMCRAVGVDETVLEPGLR